MRKISRLLAWILCFSMIVSDFSASVYVTGTEVETEIVETDVATEMAEKESEIVEAETTDKEPETVETETPEEESEVEETEMTEEESEVEETEMTKEEPEIVETETVEEESEAVETESTEELQQDEVIVFEGGEPEDNTESDTELDIEVTRIEWLTALTDAFEMSVEEDNYPDNYYSDINATSEYYYDVMLATEFGLIDVEAGDALRPDDAATREFAAHTLNLCMGYFLEGEIEYTFSEADSVTYPEDIQIAINKEWFELSGNDFLPEQGITEDEKVKMITEAENAVASVVIDETYEDSYQLAEDVIVVPEGTEILLSNENELTLYNCTTQISAGDIFVVFADGFPLARKAVAVTTTDTEMVITVEDVEMEDAFTELEAQGTIAADLTQAQAIDEDVQLSYIVGGTSEKAFEDGTMFYSLDEVGEQEVSAVVATKKIEQTDGRLRAGLEDYFTVKIKITNVKANYKVSILNKQAYLKVSGKVTVSFSGGTGDMPILGLEDSFVKVPIAGIGYFKPSLEGSISGSVALSMKSTVSAGVEWTAKNGVRLSCDFKKEAFTIQSEVEAKVGVKAAMGVDVGFVNAELFFKAGGKAFIKVTTYTDGAFPGECKHVAAHLYASVGGKVTFKLIIFKTVVSIEEDIMNEKNSPVKVALHYEDGKPVSVCSRDGKEESEDGESGGSGSGGTGNSTKKYKYYTPIDSQYAYSGTNTGVSSTGETYTIFEYSLNDEEQATITKYNGNVSALNIPSTIDGYTVVGIGNGVFKNNTRLMLVNIPDTVTSIGDNAFASCSNLGDVTLSKNLVSIGYSAFYNCDSLTSIEIPKSLDGATVSSFDSYNGAFRACDNLKEVTFEEGTIEVTAYLFANCTGLEEIVIPDTVTRIETSAFKNCNNLKRVQVSNAITQISNYAFLNCKLLSKIDMPSSLTYIGEEAFSNCQSLTRVEMPNLITYIGNFAFSNCSNLNDVILSKALVTMGYSAFYNCDKLTKIEIPKSLEETTYHYNTLYDYTGPFRDCDNLKTVTFEDGATEVATGLFNQCTGLEEIVIPDTVTIIETFAFENCKNLKKVEIPNSVTIIDCGAFYNCVNLTDVVLPKSLGATGMDAFYNCDGLTSIEIPKSLGTMTRANDNGSFGGCDNLKEVSFEEGTTKIVESLFLECTGLEEIIIPDTVTEIGGMAFRKCENLKSVKMTPSVTKIGGNAFSACSNLADITLYDGLEKIDGAAFNACTSLKEIAVPDTVTSIGNYIFSGCTSLESVKLPKKLESITEEMFKNCTSLKSIEIPKTVTTIMNNAFRNSGLITVILPEKLKSIGVNAFYNCDKLQEITIPNSVNSVNKYCFADCEILSKVNFGSGITKVNSYAFDLCPSLKKIVFPYSIKTVAANAFTNCVNLIEVIVPPATSSIEQNAFSYPDKMTVYGVAGTYAETWATEAGAIFVSKKVEATKVELDESELTIYKGNSVSLNMTVTPSDFLDEVIWRSSNTDVVTVSDLGVVKAVGAGEATVRITIGDCTASCKVTVVQPVTSISLNKTNLSMEALSTYQLLATINPDTAYNKAVKWTSSNEAVATVDATGKVTAVSKGSATITVAALDGSGIKKTCSVTVTNNGYVCMTPEGMESEHDYVVNCEDFWIYTDETAYALQVTFDEQTCIEEDFDYLYIYNADGERVGKYTGTELAGQTIEVFGNAIKIKLDSDAAGTAWGFKVVSIMSIAAPLSKPKSDIVSGSEVIVGKTIVLSSDEEANIYYTTDGSMPTAESTLYTEPIIIAENVTIKAIAVKEGYLDSEVAEFTYTVEETGDPGEVVDTGSCGKKATWTLYGDGTLKITGTGKMDDFEYYSPWYEEYRDTVKRVEIGKGITYVGAWSFYSHYSLKSVAFSSTVKTIGDSAFYGADQLAQINDFEKGLLRVPETVENIYDNSFSSTGFTDVYLDGNLKEVGVDAFEGLELDTFTIQENIGNFVLGNSFGSFSCDTLCIGEGVTTEWWQTKYCYKSTGVCFSTGNIEDAVQNGIVVDSDNTEMCVRNGILCLQNDTGYTLYSVPSNIGFSGFPSDIIITEIGENVFNEMNVSGVLVIPDTVTKIAGGAFGDCDNLTEVILPSGLVSLGHGAFAGCDNLTKVNIPKSLENNIRVDSGNFRCFQDTPLSDITFEEGITKIPAGLFHSCLLSSITIPDTVIELEDNVFRYCENLTSVELPEGLKTIGYYCFADSGLKTIVLPSTIKTIKDSFWGLELERLTVKSKDTINFMGDGYFNIKAIHGYPYTYIHDFAAEQEIPFYDLETGELCEKLDYFITYELDGGVNNPANPIGYKKNEVVTLLEPTKDGVQFGGWFLENGRKITSVSGQNVTVYAKWFTGENLWVEDIEVQTYTGKAIKPQVEVYDGDILLEEKKDYTVTYKNNTKVAGNGAAKNPPSIVITGKGNYSGKETITFTIAAKDIGEDDITVTPILLKYNKKIQKPVPVLKYNGKTLKNKTDFTIEYPNLEEGAYKEAGTYTILLKGKGNFTGEREITFTITENTLMSKVSVAKVKNQPYTGEEIIPGLTVKNGKVLLEEGIDYTVTFENNVEIGTATATLTGMGDYSGEKTITFKITGGSISKAKVTGVPKSVVYTGEAITSDSEIWSDEPVLTVTVNKEVKILEEGIDYTISYLKNTNKGTATIVFTGINGYSGTLKKNFKITAYDMKKNLEGMFNATVEEIVVYAKGGSKPKPVVTFGDTVLVEGKDYTLSYKNHTKVNDGTNLKKLPTVTIKGKGNFSGSISLTYTIEAQSLSEMTISVPDKTYANKKNAYKSTPKLVDLDGKTLKAGTDYEKALVYSYRDETILADETIRSAGEVVGANDIVPAGTVIVVTAMGKGNYLEGTTIQGEYRITKASITSAKVQIPAQFYTGEEICPDKDEITIKVGKVTLEDSDYEIVSYENNINKGKAKVTIKGVGNYGGTKTITFTIKAKGLLWWWR